MSKINKLKAVFEANKIVSKSNEPKWDELPLNVKTKLLSSPNISEEIDKVISELMYLNEEKDKIIKDLRENSKQEETTSLDDKYIKYENEINNLKSMYESIIKKKNKEIENLESETDSLSKKLEVVASEYEKLFNDHKELRETAEKELKSMESIRKSSESLPGEPEGKEKTLEEPKSKKIELVVENPIADSFIQESKEKKEDTLAKPNHEIENHTNFDIINNKKPPLCSVSNPENVEYLKTQKERIVEISQENVFSYEGHEKEPEQPTEPKEKNVTLEMNQPVKIEYMGLEKKIEKVELIVNTSKPFEILSEKKENIFNIQEGETLSFLSVPRESPKVETVSTHQAEHESPVESKPAVQAEKKDDEFYKDLFVEHMSLLENYNTMVSFSDIVCVIKAHLKLLLKSFKPENFKHNYPISFLKEVIEEISSALYSTSKKLNKPINDAISEASSDISSCNFLTFYLNTKSKKTLNEKYLSLKEKYSKDVESMLVEDKNVHNKIIADLLSSLSTLYSKDSISYEGQKISDLYQSPNVEINKSSMTINLSNITLETINSALSSYRTELTKNYDKISSLNFTGKFDSSFSKSPGLPFALLSSTLLYPKEMKSLCFTAVDITSDFLEQILDYASSIPSLTELGFIQCTNLNHLTLSTIVKKLIELKIKLSSLVLKEDNLNYSSMEHICKYIEFNDELTNIDISKNPFEENEIEKMFSEISKRQECKGVNVNIEGVSIQSFLFLAKYFKDFPNNKITSLNLSNNELELQNALYIGSDIKKAKGLKKLSLRNMKMNGEAITALINLGLGSVEEIDCGDNEIGEVGAFGVGKFLSRDETVKVVKLENCGFNDFAMQGMINCISLNQKSALKEVHLEGNSIGNEGVKAIEEFCKKNTETKFYISPSESITIELPKAIVLGSK